MNISRRALCLTALTLFSTTSTAFAGQSCAMTATGSLCLNGPASRIVSLDQQSTEFLLALGVQPVAVAGIDNYRKFTGDQAPRLGASVPDIGLSSSPNVEVIMALQPDLIVGNIFSIQKSRPLLAQIAPLAAFSSAPDGEPDQLRNMARTLRAFAVLTGRQPAAERFLAQLDADISRARQRIGIEEHDFGACHASVYIAKDDRAILQSRSVEALPGTRDIGIELRQKTFRGGLASR